jgi:molecular chaperone GrpE
MSDEAPPNAAAEAGETSDQVIIRIEAEMMEAKDRALRATAELENVRKRLRKEMEDERRYAATPLLTDLLQVVDNLARAISAADKNADVASLLAGVKMVATQLDGVLVRHHCTRIPALGEPFDPNVHAAIGQQPSVDKPANTVIIVAQEGFKLHDRVLRPAQVIVSSPPDDGAKQQAAQQQ